MSKFLKPLFSNIPEAITKLNQWVLFRAEIRDGKETKPLYKPGGRYAKSNDPHTWSSFEACQKALPVDGADGLGFVLTKDDPFIGIDFDKCYCPAFKIIDPAIEQYIKSINTYTEFSPSNRGFRLLLRGKRPNVDGRRNGRVEVYQSKRYVTITGHRLNGYPASIEARQAELDTFYKQAFPEKAEDSKQSPADVYRGRQIICEDWQERLQKAFNSKINGDKIRQLNNGDTSGYASPSEADLAFCSYLAFYMSGDPAALDAAFRASKLYRPKWDKKHHSDGRTYGRGTIDEALKGCKEFYQESLKSIPRDTLTESSKGETKTASQTERKGAKFRSLTELEGLFSKKVTWLYRQHIPKGMPIIFNGREQIGKTSICIQIANEILAENPEGIIVWIASEGFIQETLHKMYELGSDMNRLILLENEDGSYLWNFSLNNQRRLLDDKMNGEKILMVIIDSIRGISHYGDNDSEIKNVMMPLNAIICDKHGASLTYLDHWKKGVAATVIDKMVGSMAKAAAVRRVFSVLPVSSNVRKIVLAKENLMSDPPPDLITALTKNETGHRLIIYESNEKVESTVIGQAEQWLINLFSEKGTYKATDVYRMGEKCGFSDDVLKKAKLNLKIESQKDGFGKEWFWKCNSFLDESHTVSIHPSRRNEEKWQKKDQ